MRLTNQVFITIAISLLITCVLWFKPYKNTVVCFDMQKIQGQFIRQLAVHKATDAQVTQATLQFKSILQKTLTTYSKKHGVLILDSKFLLAGGVDVTELVAKELAVAMRKSS